jgi:hypothetical protein
MPVSRKSAILFLALTAALVFFFGRDDPVTLSAPTWTCAYQGGQWQCAVTFQARNKSQARQSRKVSIKGMVMPAGGKAASLTECGAKVIDLHLLPLEIETIHAGVPMTRKPTAIELSILD